MSSADDDTVDTDAYREAVGVWPGQRDGGFFAPGPMSQQERDWHDKPWRLVYDLANEVDRLRQVVADRDTTIEQMSFALAEGVHIDEATEAQMQAAWGASQLQAIRSHPGIEALRDAVWGPADVTREQANLLAELLTLITGEATS